LTLLGPPNLTQKGPKRVQKGVKRVIFDQKGTIWPGPLFDQKGVRFWENWDSLKQGLCPEEFDPFGTPESDPKRSKKGPKRGQKGVKRVIFDQKGTIWPGPLFDQKGVRFWKNRDSSEQGITIEFI
jgi:hypothetical protein